ncbi:MAG TPA: hypothetical protein VIK89_04125 [Cytophagaceae bacterium]
MFFSCDTQKETQLSYDSMSPEEISENELQAKRWESSNLKYITAYDFINTDKGLLLTATSVGVFSSTNNGLHWKQYSSNALSGKVVTCLAASGNGGIFAGAQENGLFYSEDNGVSWQKITETISNENNELIVNTVCYSNGYVFIGTKSNGIFRSADLGKSWHPANNGISTLLTSNSDYFTNENNIIKLLSDNNVVYALTQDGMYKSETYGDSWIYLEHKGMDSPNMVSCLADKDDLLFAGRFIKDGVYVSEDQGKTWRKSGLQGENIYCLKVGKSGAVYAGTDKGEVFRTTDNGITWQKITKGLPKNGGFVYSLGISPNGYILASLENKGITRFSK